MGKEKWLLDTDIGCDNDDCMALGYLLARDDIELMGITTVSGECHRRALLADVMCTLADKKIPICCGNDNSLIGDCVQYEMGRSQSEQVDKYRHNDIPTDNKAVLFMKKIIEENPNEIILACIGQLTNIALLFAAYPHIPSLLKGVIAMGGRFYEDESFDTKKWGIVEWNIKCDPFAAKIVFDADVKNFYIAGVEQTCRFSKSVSEVSKKVRHIPYMVPVADAVLEMEKVWFHDPVAIWAMLNKNEVEWKRGNISVDLENTDMGLTSFKEDKNGKHIVLSDIDVDKFFDNYAEQLGFKWD